MLCRHLGGPHPSPNLEQNVLMLSYNSPMCGCHIVMLGDMMDGFLGGDGRLEVSFQPMKTWQSSVRVWSLPQASAA